MRTVFKFPVSVRGWNHVTVGAPGKVVLTAIDPASGGPAVWLETDTEAVPVDRWFCIVRTGSEVPDDSAVHVGSMVDRDFVWHVYERNQDGGN